MTNYDFPIDDSNSNNSSNSVAIYHIQTNEETQIQGVPNDELFYKLSKRRWAILAGITIFGFSNGFVSFSPSVLAFLTQTFLHTISSYIINIIIYNNNLNKRYKYILKKTLKLITG